MRERDPFSGTWTFQSELSALSTPGPRSWRQEIQVMGDEVRVREEIIHSTGEATVMAVDAKLDGQKYPVTGSPFADAIAYTRVDSHTVTGVGYRGDQITIRETVSAGQEADSLSMSYKVLDGERQLAEGVAVFRRADIATGAS